MLLPTFDNELHLIMHFITQINEQLTWLKFFLLLFLVISESMRISLDFTEGIYILYFN